MKGKLFEGILEVFLMKGITLTDYLISAQWKWCNILPDCSAFLLDQLGCRKVSSKMVESQSSKPYSSLFSNLLQIKLLSKACESWMEPGHLATTFMKRRSASQMPCTFNDMKLFLQRYISLFSCSGIPINCCRFLATARLKLSQQLLKHATHREFAWIPRW